MSGLVTSPPPAITPSGMQLTTGGFWPDIDLNHYRDTARIGGSTITNVRLTEALMGAVISAARDLKLWKSEQIALGYETLAEVPSDLLGDVTELVFQWRRAVYAYATADLTETHRDLTATAAGAARAEEQATSADEHRRNAISAIRDMLGINRVDAELI